MEEIITKIIDESITLGWKQSDDALDDIRYKLIKLIKYKKCWTCTSEKINLICDKCERKYCDNCWIDCNDEYFDHTFREDGICHTEHGCDNCNY